VHAISCFLHACISYLSILLLPLFTFYFMICDWGNIGLWLGYFFYSGDPRFMSLIDSPWFVKFSKRQILISVNRDLDRFWYQNFLLSLFQLRRIEMVTDLRISYWNNFYFVFKYHFVL
jgi:hypothetical protein